MVCKYNHNLLKKLRFSGRGKNTSRQALFTHMEIKIWFNSILVMLRYGYHVGPEKHDIEAPHSERPAPKSNQYPFYVS